MQHERQIAYNGICAGCGTRIPPSEGDSAVLRSGFRTIFAILVVCGSLSTLALAQAPTIQPEAKPPAPAANADKVAGFNAWQKAREERMKNDWPWLGRFKEADLKLAPPAAGEDRVVFMGDSITEGWRLDGYFKGKPYINRGISGQTTPQMLVRFRQDVIDLKPKVVVLLAGINDIAGNTGPMTLEQTEDNLASMAELAAAHRIRVVMCSVLPAFDFSWKPGMTPAPKVAALNEWIKAYAAEKGHVYVDYYTPMKDERGGLPPALSADGVHPLPAGYAIMTPLVEAGIKQGLGTRE